MNLEKQALGRVAHLGHLYDARSDSFLGFSMFNCDINPSALRKTDLAFTDISYLISASISEKLLKLCVDAQLKLSVLSGLVSVDGSAKYLTSAQNEQLKLSSADLFYKMTTAYDEVDITKLSEDEISKKFLLTNATHAVVGIKWGANVIGSFEYEWTDDETKRDVEG